MNPANTITTTERYELSWARLVSDVLSPPVVWTLLAFPLALAEAGVAQSNAIAAATLYGFLVCWVPVMFIAWMVKRGKISDIHMKHRRQRFLPFSVSITCSAGALWAIWTLKAGTMLLLFGLATLLGLVVLGVVTLFWQISIHAMSITSAVMMTAIVFGSVVALWLLPLIGVVAAARLRLHRHTPAQLVAGGMLGAFLPYLVTVMWG